MFSPQPGRPCAAELSPSYRTCVTALPGVPNSVRNRPQTLPCERRKPQKYERCVAGIQPGQFKPQDWAQRPTGETCGLGGIGSALRTFKAAPLPIPKSRRNGFCNRWRFHRLRKLIPAFRKGLIVDRARLIHDAFRILTAIARQSCVACYHRPNQRRVSQSVERSRK